MSQQTRPNKLDKTSLMPKETELAALPSKTASINAYESSVVIPVMQIMPASALSDPLKEMVAETNLLRRREEKRRETEKERATSKAATMMRTTLMEARRYQPSPTRETRREATRDPKMMAPTKREATRATRDPKMVAPTKREATRPTRNPKMKALPKREARREKEKEKETARARDARVKPRRPRVRISHKFQLKTIQLP